VCTVGKALVCLPACLSLLLKRVVVLAVASGNKEKENTKVQSHNVCVSDIAGFEGKGQEEEEEAVSLNLVLTQIK
jgi:hypothetical protein